MDLSDSPEQARFRARLRAWLADNLPKDAEPDDARARFARMREWLQRLHEGGWAALSWPVEYGGQGLGPFEESILSQELGRAGAQSTPPTGHLGRPFLTYGTEQQRREHLPGMLNGDHIWCQGFSEPSAGSDLASLRTRADRRGADYILSGQKVWTSFGAFADHCLVLARTDQDVPKHKGISVFILRLDTPGVTVRPIVLANGEEEFAEIFLDEVVVPASDMLGQPGQGWEIALSTISYERGAADIGYQTKFDRYLSELFDQCQATDQIEDPAVVEQLGELAVSQEVFRLHCLRGLSSRAAGAVPGAASSIDKLLMTAVEQNLLGAAVQLVADRSTDAHHRWFDRYIYARAGSIYGGSAQIQKGILAERVLGLRFRAEPPAAQARTSPPRAD